MAFMRIFMLCDFYNESLEYQENLLVKYYRKQGHDVMVVTSTFESVFDYYNDRHDQQAPARDYLDQGARILKLPYRYNLFNRLRAYPRIDALLEDFRPDLIFVHDIMPNLPECVRYLKRRPACRMILDYHADYSNSGRNWLSLKLLHGVLRKRFLDMARPHLSRIFPIVPAGAVFLHEVYGVPHEEMEILPLGADTDLGEAVRAGGARQRLRSTLGLSEQALVVFTGGKLDPLKRAEDLIAAVRRCQGIDVHLLIVGEAAADQTRYKEQLLAAAGDATNIHFRGWQKATGVYEHLAAADIAAFPASQSILWQQAISMGLPLIVGERSAGATQLQDVSYLNLADNIVVLNESQPLVEQMHAHIESLASDPALRERMAAGARTVSHNQLNWNSLTARTLRFCPASIP